MKFEGKWKYLTSVYAPISVKPEGGGVGHTHGNLTVAYIPRVGILIGHLIMHLIFQFYVVEEK